MAMLNHAKADPDLDIVRNDPRFQADGRGGGNAS